MRMFSVPRSPCISVGLKLALAKSAKSARQNSSDLVVVLPDRLEPFFMRIPRDALETVSSDSDTVQFLQETRDLHGEGSGPFFSESLAFHRDSVDLAVAAKPVWIHPVALPDELVIRDRRGQAVSQRGEKLDLVS